MNMELLKTFLMLCYCRNFSETAHLMYVPQPTISNRIKNLEEELGQELFSRGKKGVMLTHAGELFIPYAQQMVDTFCEASNKIHNLSEEKEVVIGSAVPVSFPFILEKITEIYDNEPNANLLLLSLYSFDVTSSLANKNIDLAFVNHPLIHKHSEFETHQICLEDMHMIISSNHPQLQTIMESDNPYTMNEFVVYYQMYYELYRFHPLMNLNYKRKLITNNFGMIRQLITLRNAISFLPDTAVKADVERGEMVCIPLRKKSFALSIPYFLIYRRNERYYEDILLKQPVNS